MSDQSRQMTPEEAAEFTEQVFNKARDGDAEMLDRLVSAGLPVNLKNSKGDTLLMLASYYGHVDAVQVLLKHKADPEMRNGNGQSPIAGAAFKGDLAVVKALVEAGAEIEGSSFDGRTALMMAAMFNRVEIVDYLISKGADPQAKDANGITALACTSGERGCISRTAAPSWATLWVSTRSGIGPSGGVSGGGHRRQTLRRLEKRIQM